MLSMRTLSQHEKEMCKRAIDNARILKNEQNVIQLEQELADCKAALVVSQNSLSACKDQLQVCKREIIANKSELDESGSILVERLMQMMQLQQQLDELSDRLEHSEVKAKDQYEDTDKRLSAIIERLTATVSRLEVDLTTVRSSAALKEESIKVMQRDSNNTSNALARELEGLLDKQTAAMECATKNAETAESHAAELRSQVAELVQSKMVMEQQIRDLHSTNDGVQKVCRKQDEALANMKHDLDAARAVETDLTLQRDSLAEKLDKYEHEVAALKSQLVSAEEETERARLDAGASRDDLCKMEEDLKVSREEAAALKSQLESAEEETERVRLDAGASRDGLCKMEKDLKVSREEAAALKSQLTSVWSEVAHVPRLQKELAAVKLQLSSSKSRMALVREESLTLQGVIDAGEKDLVALKEGWHILIKEKQLLRAQLVTARMQVEEIEQESSLSQQELAWLCNDIDALMQHFMTESASERRKAFDEIQDVIKSSKQISAQLQASVQENSSLVNQLDTSLAEKSALKQELLSRSHGHTVEMQALNCELDAAREKVEEAQGRMEIRERELERAHERTCERLERMAAEEQERASTKINELEQQVEHLRWQLDREQAAVAAERQRSEHNLSNLRDEIEEQRVKMQEEMLSEQKRMEDQSNASLEALQVVCPAVLEQIV